MGQFGERRVINELVAADVVLVPDCARLDLGEPGRAEEPGQVASVVAQPRPSVIPPSGTQVEDIPSVRNTEEAEEEVLEEPEEAASSSDLPAEDEEEITEDAEAIGEAIEKDIPPE